MTIYFNQGQTFIAVDPEAFAPDFTERMRAFMQEMRGLEPVHKYNYILSSVSLLLILNLFLYQADPDKPVLVAGDPERMHEAKVAKDGGIWYHDNLIAACVSLSMCV